MKDLTMSEFAHEVKRICNTHACTRCPLNEYSYSTDIGRNRCLGMRMADVIETVTGWSEDNPENKEDEK